MFGYKLNSRPDSKTAVIINLHHQHKGKSEEQSFFINLFAEHE